MDSPSFYLYSVGHSPKLLTLGTLVYDNYAMPEVRSVTFPQLANLVFKQMEERGEIITQPVSGCFTTTKDSQYGLGIGLCDLAELDVQYARSREKLVAAKVGRRVVLRSPDKFFERVLQDAAVLKKLTTWLTAAKSAYIFYKATFQKPKVFCLTGYYELNDAQARFRRKSTTASTVQISSSIVGAASGVPVGGRIGPFSDGQTLQADISMPGPCIWAARYHELKVDYIQIATASTMELPRTIRLLDDCTHPRSGLMGSEPVIEETTAVTNPDAIERAQRVSASLTGVTEIEYYRNYDEEYWNAFAIAESRLNSVTEDIEYGSDSSEEDD